MQEIREIVRCPHCDLNQFMPIKPICRKCGKVLFPAPPAAIEPIMDLSTDRPESTQDLVDFISERIFELRKLRNLTQLNVAEKMNVPRTYINKIENGKVLPGISSVERIARAFGISVYEFMLNPRDVKELHFLADPFLVSLVEHISKLSPSQKEVVLRSAAILERNAHAS